MSKSITINVTHKDIENAEPGSICDCPVARAIIRNLPNVSDVEVFPYAAFWEHDGVWWRASLDSETRRNIENFDDEKGMEPFSFTLDQTEMEYVREVRND